MFDCLIANGKKNGLDHQSSFHICEIFLSYFSYISWRKSQSPSIFTIWAVSALLPFSKENLSYFLYIVPVGNSQEKIMHGYNLVYSFLSESVKKTQLSSKKFIFKLSGLLHFSQKVEENLESSLNLGYSDFLSLVVK